LRSATEDIAAKTHELLEAGRTPSPVYTKRCDRCSLIEICLPRTMQKKRTVKGYISRMLDDL